MIYWEDMLAFEIDFLPVGDSNGDAICVRYGTPNAFYVHVVDGGFIETADTVIEHIRRHYGQNTFINDMVLSHADNDHACGLVGILDAIHVENLWMNMPWLYAADVIHNFHGNWTLDGLIAHIKDKHPYLVELDAIAKRKGTKIRPVFQGSQIGAFIVLAPSRDRYLRLLPDLEKLPETYSEKKGFVRSALDAAKSGVDAVMERWDIETLDDNPPATSASNETSIVQLGFLDNKLALLTADVGPEGLAEAYNYAAQAGLLTQPLNFIQVPHHGSRRNVTPTVLNAWLGQPLTGVSAEIGTAFCSVGKDADIYPRKKVKNAFTRRGYPVHTTRGTVRLHHNEWGGRVGYGASIPEPFSYNVED